MVRLDGLSVRWLGYATARIAGDDAIVYTDPGRYGVLTGEWESEYGDREHPSGGPYGAQDGDIVVVTHDHHYDDGIERVAGRTRRSSFTRASRSTASARTAAATSANPKRSPTTSAASRTATN